MVSPFQTNRVSGPSASATVTARSEAWIYVIVPVAVSERSAGTARRRAAAANKPRQNTVHRTRDLFNLHLRSDPAGAAQAAPQPPGIDTGDRPS